MSETEYTQENLAAIRTRLDNIERMTRLAVASNPNSAPHIEGLFRERAGSADLYLALQSGPKSQDELVQILGKSQPTISRIIKHLHESGLISHLSHAGRELWMWHEMERTLGISRVAKKLSSISQTPEAGPSQPDAKELPTG
jgi:biotin operon repressor